MGRRRDRIAQERFEAGAALLRRREYGAAEAAFREVVRLRPAAASGHARLGQALAGLERRGEAEASLREALRLDPEHAAAWLSWATLLTAQERFAEAEPALRHALWLNPDRAPLLLRFLGVALAAVGRYAEAVERDGRDVFFPGLYELVGRVFPAGALDGVVAVWGAKPREAPREG
jgi:tetratricopeptide (TPR) repeat protein